LRRIGEAFPLAPAEANYAGEVAERWRYKDGAGEIGVISSVTQAFCRDCSRMRLSTEGSLYTCLFAQQGHDLKALLRGGVDDDAIRDAIAAIWRARDDRYSEIRTAETAKVRKVEMSYIGGSALSPEADRRRAARHLRGRSLQRARRNGADVDRGRASAHAVSGQARARHPDDARPRAGSSGHRFPAQ